MGPQPKRIAHEKIFSINESVDLVPFWGKLELQLIDIIDYYFCENRENRLNQQAHIYGNDGIKYDRPQ